MIYNCTEGQILDPGTVITVWTLGLMVEIMFFITLYYLDKTNKLFVYLLITLAISNLA
jgi:hypothetical protein